MESIDLSITDEKSIGIHHHPQYINATTQRRCEITMKQLLYPIFSLIFTSLLLEADGFALFPRIHRSPRPCALYAQGEVGRGDNWIERSFPVDTTGTSNENIKIAQDYSLGINGVDFQTGPLSKRMFDAIMTTNFQEGMSDEVKRAFTLYSMDFTAKEATRVALDQNGLVMSLPEELEDEGLWGDVDSVQLLDIDTEKPIGPLYDSFEEAVSHWTPGQPFNFVVRQVPAKMKELTLEEIIQAIDPNSEFRQQAAGANMTLPDEDINSLRDLANDVARRADFTPKAATTEINAFAGLDKRGYKVISAGSLSRDSVNADGSENQATIMHVMDALVAHGALVVDLTDGGTKYQSAIEMKRMWDAVKKFFDKIANDKELAGKLPGMTSVVGSFAKVGYADYDNGSMQFLETRRKRDGSLLPSEILEILDDSDIDALKKSFDTVCAVGKDVVRIVTAAAGMDADVFDDDQDQGDVLASQAATKLVDELVDDGKSLRDADIDHEEGPISMSPHRLCRYSNTRQDEDSAKAREVFGAHTDSSFITAVPVAAVSGLEVYDEDEARWYRPELAARLHWQQERTKRGDDPNADTEIIPGVDENEDDVELPWHARYVVLVPGEFLQIVSRDEVPSAVHRVVAVQDGPARLSAPILLRGRPGTKLDVARYLGGAGESKLVAECDGKSMDEIHNTMQPSSFQ